MDEFGVRDFDYVIEQNTKSKIKNRFFRMEIKNPSKTYKTKYNLVYSCQYHIVFTPKYRRRVLGDPVGSRLKEIIYEKQEDYEYNVIEMEVMPDHVHLLLDICPKFSPQNIVAKIKGYTSHVLRQEFKSLRTRLPNLWTRSCFISTVGSVSLEVVKQYIENQKGK